MLRIRLKNRRKLRKKQRASSGIVVMTQRALKLKSAHLTIHSLTNQQPKKRKFLLRTHLAIIKPISLLRIKNKNHQSQLLHNLMSKKIKIRKKIKIVNQIKINLLRLLRITKLLLTPLKKEKRTSMSKNSKSIKVLNRRKKKRKKKTKRSSNQSPMLRIKRSLSKLKKKLHLK